MKLRHKITTLVYLFNRQGYALMLHRCKKPNRRLWSPVGGKLRALEGESPYECAVREVREEIGLKIDARDLHLAGIVAEHGYEGEHHWLMFIFECRKKLSKLPPRHDEGVFEFVPLGKLRKLNIPETDRQIIWPLFKKYRGGFFSVKINCEKGHKLEWKLEEVRI